MVQLELPGFAPEEFSLKTKDDVIVLEAVHESAAEECQRIKMVWLNSPKAWRKY